MRFGRKPVIYVSGPYSKPDPALNVHEAIQDAEDVMLMGGIPIVPHLTMLWQAVSPHDWDFWITYDLGLLRVCDALYRREGESQGAEIEVFQMSKIHGKPVFVGQRQKPAMRMWIKMWNEEVPDGANP